MRLPPLHDAADRASGRAQAQYLWVTRVQLAGLVLGAALSIQLWPNAVETMRVAAASLLAVSTIATVLAGGLGLRDTWYSGRAAAESVKTLSWRYAIGADPFPVEVPASEVDALFLDRLRDVLRDITSGGVRLDSAAQPGQGQVTESMREIRQSEWKVRLRTYVEERVTDQVRWYSTEAAKNDRRCEALTWVVGSLQVAAMVIAIVVATHPTWALNPVGLLTTSAAALIAWSEKKGHQELAHAYALTAQELEMATTEAAHTGKAELPRFVLDTEQAISREHTLWIARRTIRRPPAR